MKIGLDARFLVGENPGGEGMYILTLINYLIRKRIDLVLFYDSPPRLNLEYFFKNKKIKSIIIPVKNRKSPEKKFFWEQVLLPQKIKKEKIDIYHATGNLGIPSIINIPSVLTLHDIIPFLFKKPGDPGKKFFYHEVSSKISFSRARKIIAISHTTKKDFLNHFKVNPKKVKIIYPSLDRKITEKKHSKNEMEKYLKKYKLKNKNYILYLGGINRRKNIEGVIKTYKTIKEKGHKIKLVIMGRIGYSKKQESYGLKMKKMIKELGMNSDIIFTGYVPFSQKYNIISGAKVLLYPSFYEGFGMPIIEAMSCGIPIITSNLSATKEIGRKTAILVNPYNIKEISEAVVRVLKDKNLRRELTRKNLREVRKFSIEKMGKEVLKLYQSLL